MYQTIQENKLFYLDKGQGFPLLLGHSYLFDHTMWQPQIDSLAQHYRVIAPDLWGHGQSDELPQTCRSLQDLARDHLMLMEALGLDEFAVIGLSVGGMWAAEMALAAPEKIKALVLMDTFLGAEPQRTKDHYFSVLDSMEQYGLVQPALFDYIVSQFYSQKESVEYARRLRNNLACLSAERLRHSIVPLGRLIFGRPDRLSDLKKITAPAVVITGAQDKPRPPSEGEHMAKILRCAHKVIENAGHISNQEQPEPVTMALLDFLKQSICSHYVKTT